MKNSHFTGFMDGEFLSTDKIQIPVDNLSVNRGYGAFDFFPVINNKPFYIERYLKRFFNTLMHLKMKIRFTKDETLKTIQEVITRNSRETFYIKMFGLSTESDHGPGSYCKLIIHPVDVEPYEAKLYTNGAKLITKEYTRFLPQAKSTNYLPLIHWYNEMTKHDATDILYLSNGLVRETSRGNVFYSVNNTYYTPGDGILEGITRSIILDILKEKNIELVLKDFNISELCTADEIFLTSTTKKIMPIVQIDDKPIGNGNPGKRTLELLASFEAIQKDWNL